MKISKLILMVCLLVLMFTKAYCHGRFSVSTEVRQVSHESSYNIAKKTYIDSERLVFSEDGIFLNTLENEWKEISGIHHDSYGYYLLSNSEESFEIEMCSTSSQNAEPWICPNCDYENHGSRMICSNCW